MEKNISEMTREEKLERLLDKIIEMSDEEFEQLKRDAKELRLKNNEECKGIKTYEVSVSLEAPGCSTG